MKKGYAIPGISEGEGGVKVENGKYRCKAFTFRSLRGRGGGASPPPPSFQRGAGLGEGGREADFLKGRPQKPTELSQKPGLRPCCRPCSPHRTLGVLTSDFCGHFSWPRKKVPTELSPGIGGNPPADSKRVAVAPKWVSRNDSRCNLMVSGQMETLTKTI